MTKPRFKSKSWKEKKVRTPGNRLTVHHKKRMSSAARCANCGRKLSGVPRVRAEKMKRLAKTKKVPERPYGGNLCSSCMREVFRRKAIIGHTQ